MVKRLELLLALSLLVVLSTATMLLGASRFDGQVVGVGAESLVLSLDSGQTVIAVDETTNITVDGEQAGLDDVMPGFVATVSTREGDGGLMAETIAAYTPK